MPTDARTGTSGRQWLWFLLIWAAGVALFGGVVLVLKLGMGALTASP